MSEFSLYRGSGLSIHFCIQVFPFSFYHQLLRALERQSHENTIFLLDPDVLDSDFFYICLNYFLIINLVRVHLLKSLQISYPFMGLTEEWGHGTAQSHTSAPSLVSGDKDKAARLGAALQP